MPRSISIVTLVVAWVLGAGTAAADFISIGEAPPARYELLGRFRFAAYPVVVLGAGGERVEFVRTETFGGRILEYGNGPISKFNGGFLATQGASNVRSGTFTSGGRTYEGYSYTATGGPIVAGKQSHWSFDISDDVWDFDLNTFWTYWLGWRFHLWGLRGFGESDLPSQRDPNSKARKFLDEVDAGSIERKFAVDIAIVPRLPLLIAGGRLGRVDIQANLPIVYLAAGLMMRISEDVESSTYLFGYPSVQATWSFPLRGPLVARVWGKAPTQFLIVPWPSWLDTGTELGFEAGARF